MAINPFEQDRAWIPDSSVSMNDSSESDGEYVDRLLESTRSRKAQPKFDSHFYYGRPAPPAPPLDAIKWALKTKTVSDSLDEQSYLRARLQQRTNCPLCNYAASTYSLARHLADHAEIRVFEEFYSRAEAEYLSMLEEKEYLSHKIAALENNIHALDVLIRKARPAAAAAERVLDDALSPDSLDLNCPYCVFEGEDSYNLRKHIQTIHEQVTSALNYEQRLGDKKERIELQIERLEVKLEELQRNIRKFRSAPDTRNYEAGLKQVAALELLLANCY